MTDKEMQKELDSLRSQVAALSSARKSERRQETIKKVSSEPEPELAEAVTESAAIDINDPEALQSHMDKLLAQLEDEIRDMPTITTLAVFSLGVLFGRLLR